MKLFSNILGEKPRHLFIFHGLFGQSDNWNTLGKKFAEHFTTHLIDLRNHGRSPHNSDTSHNAMANDILEYMTELGIEKASLIGHSLGGKVVMKFAVEHPKKVENLIIADMAPKTYPPHHQGIIKGLESVDFEKIETRNQVEEILKKTIPEMGVRQFLLKNVYRTEDGKYAYRFNLAALSETYDDLVSNSLSENEVFYGKTLFVSGGNSNYVEKQDEPTIKKHFPQAEFIKIPQAGHWLHAEKPAEFLDVCLSFLNK